MLLAAVREFGVEVRLVVVAAALAAALVLACPADWRRRLRDRVKNQPSSSALDNSRPWKKDSDPALAQDARRFWVVFDVIKWSLLSEMNRLLMPAMLPPPNRCFYDVSRHPGVRGLVAITVDDAVCRQSRRHSLVGPLRALLQRHSARLTFFLTLRYSLGAAREADLAALVADGHELANHCEEDREYDGDTAESFEQALVRTDAFIRRFDPVSVGRWFRAPSVSVSRAMEGVLARRGMQHVVCDCYANDCHVPWPRFIAWCCLRRVSHGSILVLHMPEIGFREWDLEAISRRSRSSSTASRVAASVPSP